jgi:hypothetical protein
VNDRARVDQTLQDRIARSPRPHVAWLVYALVAVACTAYLETRAHLVPKWGQWYGGDPHPYILLQVRAFLSGRLALVPHPSGAGHDYFWGRGGMHMAWGLGIPVLATPFHLVGRMFGAPGFPDSVRFLILYAVTTALLARVLHRTARRDDPNALVTRSATAGFIMVFPTYIGLISARFQIYDQTIATGALWSVLLLSGVIALLDRCTPGRLLAVCAAAGFSALIRVPIGIYGPTTAVIAILIAQRKGLSGRVLLAGLLTYIGVAALYFVGNILRFGGPWNTGYENCLSSALPNRMTRWGLPFAKVPFLVAAKEMFATWFLLEPVPNQIMMGVPPASVQPYIVGERWREYYAPTYDLVALGVWIAALAIVCWRIVRGRLWSPHRDLDDEITTVVGAWGVPTAALLFVFYARMPNTVTRYATDAYPAFAATFLCVGMALVNTVRKRRPSMTASAQVALAAAAALYIGGWRGWARHLSQPIDRNAVDAQLAEIDSHAQDTPEVPASFKCNEPRGRPPVHTHLEDWRPDCTFRSGMVFAMPHSPCVNFTFAPAGADWTPAEEESLAHFRARADFDPMVKCAVSVQGSTRRVTMCDPHTPAFLLDGLRLYSVASLDENLTPIDRLRLMEIEAAPPCR